ncbi:histidine kinase [Pseudomonas sp. YY-1]|uniref:PAS domain S-box protein n=1 Tax=Pseudomonas sp. YY-1 TaxID=2058659 RepID=UPI000CC7C8BD|nr:PAS domain S-box protein [Pseudomonas sp. YY-1]PKQ39652.1 histidine kinase [Pseudomonas sp. YY-1]
MTTNPRPIAIRWIVIGGSLCLALFFAFLGRQALHEREALWQLQMNKQAEAQRLALQSVQHGLRERAQLLAEAIAADAWVAELVRQASVLPKDDQGGLASIRNQLYTRLAPRWRNMQVHRPFRLYVHLQDDARILLRVHEPQRFGDTQEAMRPLLLQALRTGDSRAELNLANNSIGIRAAAPLLIDTQNGQRQVGAISVAMDVLEDLPQLDRDLGAGIALLLNAAAEVGTQANHAPAWRLIQQTRPQAQIWLQADLLPSPSEGNSQRLLEDGGQHYLLSQLSMATSPQPGAPAMATVLTWRDVSELYAVHERDKRWLVVKWLLAWCGAEALLMILLHATHRSTQRLMQRQQSALHALNEISALSSLSSKEQLREALRMGANYFDMPLGVIGMIDADHYRVLVQVCPDTQLEDGQTFALNETYCSLAYAQDDILSIERMASSPYREHACYARFALESYIGTAIWVDGRRVGTLAFCDQHPRDRQFDENEREFLRLFARWVGATLEREQQQQARQNLLERLASIIEGTDVGTWEWNVQSGATVFNERWAQMLGYHLEELQPTSVETWKRFCHPDDREPSERMLRRHFAGELAFYDRQIRMQHRDGRWLWVQVRGRLSSRDEQGRPLLMYGTHTDISAARQREDAVIEARAFLQTVLDSASGVAIIATDPNGLVTLFNSGAERLLGYSSDTVIGQMTPERFHLPSEIDARAQQLSISCGHPVSGFQVFTHNVRNGESETRQWTYVHKDGSQRLVNLTTNAIFDASGQITGFLGIASDISALQQATRALQQSESRFRGLVANLPGVVYRCANDSDWSMRYVSDEILSLTGYPPSDFIDNRVRSFSSIVHPDDLPITYLANDSIARQETFELTYRLRHADGHSVWVREKGRGEHDAQGRLVWVDGFIWDISERKVMEDDLRLSQHLFSSAFTTAPQGMALVAIDGRWLEVNDELCRMLGYSREEMLALDFQRITHPDDLGADLRNVDDLLAGRISAYQMEKRYLDKQGQVLWVLLSSALVRNAQGQPVHLVAQIQDFSDRVAAERAIREREHYLRTLLDNVIDAIVTLDDEGHIETFNHAAERIFAYSQAEVAGRDIATLIPGMASDTLRQGCASDQIREMEGLRLGGERFPLELAMSQISHQGQVRFIAVIRDIAERKRIEQMKNEFVSTVSHELRTPLTAIAGSLGLINGGALGAVPQAMAHMLSIAEANSQRLSALINDLLDMEKLVAGKMHFDLQRRPLKPLLELALLHNQPYADQHQVRLELHAEHDVEVRVDTQRLAQVLANLLSNAAKFSPAGAVVQVSLETMADKLRVSVRDHGPGIPAAFHSRIFAKFSQADAGDTRQKGGTGLGLAICKEIIERMHGRIGFHSVPGQGATFWFELPRVDESET